MPTLNLEKILSCSNLPSLSAVALQVLELTQDENVKLTEIASAVENDQALTAKILRTINSSYYGLAKPCPTIARALAYLGLNTVKSVVLGFTLVDVTKQAEDGFDLVDYWRRCLYSAAAARRIAMQSSACDPEEAFIAALVQDMGMLAIHAASPSPYACLVQQTKGDHRRLPEMERAVFGFDHAEVGARLATQWRFPPQFGEDHPPIWQRPQDVDNNIWWINMASPFARLFSDESADFGVKSLPWRTYNVERIIDILVQIGMTHGPESSQPLSSYEWINAASAQEAEIRTRARDALEDFVVNGVMD